MFFVHLIGFLPKNWRCPSLLGPLSRGPTLSHHGFDANWLPSQLLVEKQLANLAATRCNNFEKLSKKPNSTCQVFF